MPEVLNVNSPAQPVAINAAEAALLVAILRSRATMLNKLLDAQIQQCPAGDGSWADTADALEVTNSVMIKLCNAQLTLEGGQGNG